MIANAFLNLIILFFELISQPFLALDPVIINDSFKEAITNYNALYNQTGFLVDLNMVVLVLIFMTTFLLFEYSFKVVNYMVGLLRGR